MSDAVLAHVARLHYVRDLTKQEIARKLGISRFKVARLLEQARAEGIVRIEVSEPVAIADEASRRLEERYELQLAVVVQEDAIPAGLAGLLPGLLDDGEVVGVAWGATVSAAIELLPAAARGIPVVQICGAMPGLEPGTGPTEVALRLGTKLGGPVHTLPAPALPSRAARDELLAHDTIRPTVELFPRVTTAIVGVGTRPEGGHVLVHVFDRDGRMLDTDLPDRAIALPLVRPRRARVIAAAGGRAKADAVRGALRAGLVDVLVTDEACAVAALA